MSPETRVRDRRPFILRHRVIAFRELFEGTIDSAAVYPREVVEQVLGCNAAAAIFAHNHRSEECEPSHTDVRLTRKLVDALFFLTPAATVADSGVDSPEHS